MSSVQTLHIRNMVCPRCVKSVRDSLNALGYNVKNVALGEVEIASSKSINLKVIEKELRKNGFELLVDKDERRVEQIKVALIEYVNGLESADAPLKISTYLSQHLKSPYTQLSKLFSKKVGHTIEKHVIFLKIERVKELVSYGDLTLSEIAYQLKYSSVQHLSTQFKNATGFSVSEYKQLGARHRHPLDAIA